MKKPLRAGLLFIFAILFTTAFAQSPEFGEASYYDDSFQGSLTAHGVKYNKNEMVASHKLHPFGTMLRVTRLDNKKSVVVKVIDKGPYYKGRVVDLSRKAAEALGMIDEGVVDVKVEVISTPSSGNPVTASEPKKTPATITEDPRPAAYSDESTRTRQVSNPVTSQADTKTATEATSKNNVPVKAKTETSKGAGTQAPTAKLVGKDYVPYDLYQIQLLRPAKKGFGVQVASLVTYEYVLRQVADLQAKGFKDVLVSVERGPNNTTAYKIILGNFDTEAAALNYKKDLKRKFKIDGFTTDLSATQY